ncbi:thymidylate kinase-domain-containing protein [Xylariomycetidae sp. FL2044]|nr:thymidylate kinase-domain-containing protein [Xylariomycetidae sp. FL2044]
MASINDLAAAATIASSAVALQSSSDAHQQEEQPSGSRSPTPRISQAAPLSPSPSSAAAQPPVPTDQAPDSSTVVAAPASSEPPPEEEEEEAAAAAAAAAASVAVALREPPPPPLTSPKSPAPASAPDKPSVSPNPQNPAPPSAGASGPVLVAPRISPRDPALTQIPAPAPPPPAGEDSSSRGGLAVGATPVDGDIMDGIEMARPQPPVRGAFIVFEGMDRAGKTTQAKLLQQRCIESGRNVTFMRFPDRTTPIGQMIDAYLKGQANIEDHVIHLLFSANRWEAAKRIKTELEAGRSIICDRFYHSGIVYSAAKQLPSLSLSWAKAPEVGLPRPDMVLFLDLEEAVARARGGWGGEVYEKGEMQRRVRELFWGLSMGDLGKNSRRQGGGGAGREGPPPPPPPVGGAGPGPGAERSSSSLLRNNGIISGVGSGGGGGGIPGGGGGASSSSSSAGGGGGGGEAGEFRQEREDIQIVEANLGVEELSETVWKLVLPRLRAVERGEVGRTGRIVR